MQIATWNLQRSPTIDASGNASTRAEAHVRTIVLNMLLGSDLCFLTEVGKDLKEKQKDPLQQGEMPGGGRAWMASQLNDNQDYTAACKTLLYSSSNPHIVTLKTKSGGLSAHRFPACAMVRLNEANVLVISAHSTSGYHGSENTEAIIDEAKELMTPHYAGFIVGGDFNSSHTDGGFRMPGCSTNQGASDDSSPLDGFYCYENPDATNKFSISITNVKALHEIDAVNHKLLRAESTILLGTPRGRGFYRMQSYTEGQGMAAVTRDAWWRLSDHTPVVAHLDVKAK